MLMATDVSDDTDRFQISLIFTTVEAQHLYIARYRVHCLFQEAVSSSVKIQLRLISF